MNYREARKSLKEIGAFVDLFRDDIGRSEQMRNCHQYLTGLILQGERKSIEPLCERVPGSDIQSLQQFVNQCS